MFHARFLKKALMSWPTVQLMVLTLWHLSGKRVISVLSGIPKGLAQDCTTSRLSISFQDVSGQKEKLLWADIPMQIPQDDSFYHDQIFNINGQR